jgi:hypothetical protein
VALKALSGVGERKRDKKLELFGRLMGGAPVTIATFLLSRLILNPLPSRQYKYYEELNI